MGSMIVVGITFLLMFVIIKSGIPTTHQINITVVVGITFTTVILSAKFVVYQYIKGS